MKKVLTLVCFVAAALVTKAQYQPKNTLKMNPVSVLVKTGNISYERAINKSQSAQLGAFYSNIGLGSLKYQGFGITPEYRFYINSNEQKVMNGGYVAPFLRYQQFSLSEKESTNKARFETFGGGVVMGWEKRFPSGFVVDLFAGPSYNHVQFKSGDESDFSIKGGMKGFGLRTGISLGFTF
jgi:hypothetical protein